MLILFIWDINESYVIMILNEHILKILFLYSFVWAPFLCMICDILTVLQTFTQKILKKEMLFFGPNNFFFWAFCIRFGTKTWVPMLPCSTLPGAERTCVVVCLLCFILQCKQFPEHFFVLTWQSYLPIFWYNVKFLQ